MKLPFTEEERAAMVTTARLTAIPDYEGFWRELQERMDIREQSKPVVEPRNSTHH